VNRKILRSLIVGNLLVYAAIGLWLAYADSLPTPSFMQASSDQTGARNSPLISIILPTPTEFAPPQTFPPITPISLDTPIPTGTPPPQTAGNHAMLTPTSSPPPPPTIIPVKDRGLVPPSNLNIILMGTDRRPSQLSWRTDTLILVTVNQEEKTVGLLSIPRDLWVQIPGIGAQRINTADFYGEYYHLPGGGPQSIKSTIERNLGIRVHYYVRVGFDGFRKGIDTLGGVDVDVDCALQENNFYDDYGRADLNFQPGVQHMDGVTALRYARSRETTNDFDRARRQRKVLIAMWDKALSLNLLPKWPELYSQFRDSVQTDMGPVELTALAWIGSQLHLDRLKSRAIDNRLTTPWTGPAGEDVLLPQPEKIHSLLVDFFSDSTGTEDPFEAENARVQIVSGNPQAANIAVVALERQGFNMTNPQAAPTLAATSSILINHPEPATVQRLVDALRISPGNVRTVNDPSAAADIQVILGQDYNSCQR
jgi:polyisoprenyl-teichoic acid--peptidoglycan teichoic acid transferase